jgi:hypothetical protein
MSRFPVIFLDFDGVLNSHAYLKNRGGVKDLDPRAVALLNEILRRSKAKIVVSSMWRLGGIDSVRGHLKRVGCIGEVIGITPVLSTRRGNEIAEWLSINGEQVSTFVILDDDSDMEHLLPRLVQTTFATGLQAVHVERALGKLLVPWAQGLILRTGVE